MAMEKRENTGEKNSFENTYDKQKFSNPGFIDFRDGFCEK